MISIGLGYIINHVVSTKFVIDIYYFSLYCVISNYPVRGYIIVTAFIFKFSFCTCLLMKQGPIRSSQGLFHGISAASLDGHLPNFIFDHFVRCQMTQFSLPSGRRF